MDITEVNDRTPLLLAASKGCWETVHVLMQSGANLHHRDNNMGNFLHLAIQFGGKLAQLISKYESRMSVQVCVCLLAFSRLMCSHLNVNAYSE